MDPEEERILTELLSAQFRQAGMRAAPVEAARTTGGGMSAGASSGAVRQIPTESPDEQALRARLAQQEQPQREQEIAEAQARAAALARMRGL